VWSGTIGFGGTGWNWRSVEERRNPGPAKLPRRFDIEEATVVAAEEREDGILILLLWPD
jgi:hypothetical protein